MGYDRTFRNGIGVRISIFNMRCDKPKIRSCLLEVFFGISDIGTLFYNDLRRR